MDEGEQRQGRAGRAYGAGDEDRVEAVCALAEGVVDGPGEGRTHDEPPELGRRQDAVRPAAVALRRDVGDEGLTRRTHGGSADALEEAECDEPHRLERGREEEHGHGVQGDSRHHDGLAAQGIAEPAEG